MGHLLEEMERIRAERIARRTFPDNLKNVSITTEDDDNSGCDEDKNEVTEDKSEIINDIDQLLAELKKNEPTSDDQFFRLAILTYEMGDLNRSIVYAMRFKDDDKTRIAHMANGKLALADILTQLYLLCISLKWNFHELRKLGAEHLKERHEDFKRQGWGDIK